MKVINAKNWDLTPAADGRRYSKYPAGDVGFAVWVSATIDGVEPGYRIKPPGGEWGAWQAGHTEGLFGGTGFVGVTTSVAATLLPAGDIAFASVATESLNTLTESAAVVITTQGHELQVRRKSSADNNATRYVDIYLGDVVKSWAVSTGAVAEPPPPGDPPPPPEGDTDPYPLQGTEHVIPLSTTSFSASGVSAGSTITIAGGVRAPLTIIGAVGTAENPILIRNQPSSNSPVIIRRESASSGGFIFTIRNCKHVIVDGLNKWSGAPSGLTYGIQVTSIANGDAPSVFLMYNGSTTHAKTRGVLVDGNWHGGNESTGSTNGQGFHILEHGNTIPAVSANVWRENFIWEFCKATRTKGTGMYFGPNYSNTDWRLRNIEVRYCIVDTVGHKGINLKCVLGGTNSVHHNYVRRTGQEVNLFSIAWGAGIPIYEGAYNMSVYNNWIEEPGGAGIAVEFDNLPANNEYVLGNQNVSIYNNVILRTGSNTAAGSPHGLHTWTKSGSVLPHVTAYNNTIVGPFSGRSGTGLNFQSNLPTRIARNNIITGGYSPAIANASTSTDNLTVAVGSVGFVSSANDNYRLLSGSDAVDGATANYPSTDYDDNARPFGSTGDIGAFEYQGV